MEILTKVIIISVAIGSISANDIKCKSAFDAVVTEDCQTMYRCVWGRPVKMPPCQEGLIFSPYYHVCVWKGSQFDECQFKGSQTVNQNGGKPKTDGCSSSPCKHGGYCEEGKDGGSFTCNCPLEYGGTTCERALTKAEQCARDAKLVTSHPDECQLYYDCSVKNDDVTDHLEQYLQECPYPQLFSEATQKCENFTEVDCGKRTEHKSACKLL